MLFGVVLSRKTQKQKKNMILENLYLISQQPEHLEQNSTDSGSYSAGLQLSFFLPFLVIVM